MQKKILMRQKGIFNHKTKDQKMKLWYNNMSLNIWKIKISKYMMRIESIKMI